MKSIILCIVLAACVTCVASAQGGKGDKGPRPNLSGTWVFSRTESSGVEATLVITHRDPELKIRQTLVRKGREETREYTYYTDGRGESNPMYYGAGVAWSKTKWDGDKVKADDDGREQTWRLSPDGQKLTYTSAIFGYYPADNPGRLKRVFRRAG